MAITTKQIQGLSGSVFAQDSNKVGSVGDIYLDDATGAPSWITVKTGLFGMSESLVPLESARAYGDDIYVAYTEDRIKNAPRIDPDGSLSPQEENELYEYYDLSAGNRPFGHDDGPGRTEVQAGNTAGAVTVSGEKVDVGIASDEAGRTRLRKYVSESVTKTAPVRHEEVPAVGEEDVELVAPDHTGHNH